MADRLQGIAFGESDFISMLQSAMTKGDVKKKVDVEVSGGKEIEKLTNNFEKLNSIKTDKLTSQLNEITTLLSKRFSKVNLNQFTSQLIQAFQDPTKSAEELSTVIDDVHTSLTTLASISNSGSFVGFNESEIRKAIQKQQKVLELRKQFESEYSNAKTKTKKQKPVDIITRARVEKIQKQSSSDVAASLGVDSSKIDVKNGDDTLLQTYQQTADLLAKMVSEKKEYNKLNKANVGDYLKQEQDILSVFQQLQDIEKQISEKFGISSKDFLSNQFKSDNGQFDFVKNAEQAVKTYVTTMTSSTKKALQEAQTKLSEQLNTAATKSVDRLGTANEKVNKTSERLGGSGASSDNGTTVQAGAEIGESVAVGMEKAEGATESATKNIQNYILSLEESIGAIQELYNEIARLDKEMDNPDITDKRYHELEKEIDSKYLEIAKHRQNVHRLGKSDSFINTKLNTEYDIEDIGIYVNPQIDKNKKIKEELDSIRKYVESEPVEASMEIVTPEETQQLEETKSSLQIILDYLNQLNTQSLKGLVDDFSKLPEPIKAAADELGLLNKEKNGFDISNNGGENHGVIVGDNTLISRTGTQQKYEDVLELKRVLDQAAEAGVNVSRILDVVFDSKKNTILELQKTVPGQVISNIGLNGDSTDNLSFNEALLQATDEQIIKLITDIEKLNSLGIDVDFNDSNFLYDKEKGFSIIDLKMKGVNSSDFGSSELLDMFSYIKDEFDYAGKDTSAIDTFIERIKTAITLRNELQKPGGNTGLLETTDSEEKLNTLKTELQSLREELQRFKDTGVEPEGIADLQAKLEAAEQHIRSLSDELSLLYEHSVSESDYSRLEEELSLAKANAEDLRESLVQVKSELEQSKIEAPLDSDALDKKVTELQYLHDKVRTIFDGPDGIVNEDMTYSEKFNSSEVQRMIELLNQLSDAELRATGVMPDDEDSYNTFRYNLQAEVDAIKETQEMLQQAYNTGNYDGFDASEIDVSIWNRLEHIYEMAQEVTNQFDSKLTPAVREFLGLVEGEIGSENMVGFLGEQNIDSYVNDIISGAKTAKEAFADLENSFGWDTARFDSLIPIEVPQELKGLYDSLFSDVENRIKSAEQAAAEFNAELAKLSTSGNVSASADQSAQSDIQAAEAAEQRAQANEHLAESEQQVDAAESANTSTPDASIQTDASVTESAIDAEMSKLDQLKNKIATEIPQAIEAKNSAFRDEQSVVESVIGAEVEALTKLEGGLKGVTDAAKNKTKAFQEQPTANDKQNTSKSNSKAKTSGGTKDTGTKKSDGNKEQTEQEKRDQADAAALAQYNSALSEYITLERQRVNLAKEGTVKQSAEQESKRLEYIRQMDSIQKQWNKTQSHSNELQEEFDQLINKRASKQQLFDTDYLANYNKYAKNITHYGARLTTIDTLLAERSQRPEAFSGAMDDLVEKGEELKKLFPLDPTNEKALEHAKNLSDEIQRMTKEIRANPEYKNATATGKEALSRKAEQWATNNSAALKADPAGFQKVREAIRDINDLSSQNEASRMLDEFIAKSNEAGKAGASFADTLKQRFKSLGAYLLSFASFYRVIGWVREAVQTITELDTAMVELKKVSDESAKSYSDFMKQSFDMADEVGTTSERIIQSTADWKRLGRSFEESKKLAQQSTVLMNVSEFENINDATEAMVSATQAYTDVASEDIIDKLNHVGNNFAVGTSELATGLQNAAAVLKTQGNDIDEALALLTAGNLIGQDMSKASAGIRTISLRISGTEEAKDEIAEMGEDVDDFVVRTKSKTDQIIRDYTAVASNAHQGISVLDDNGNLRDTYSILLDISKIYKEIQEEDKQYGTNRAQALVETLAGKNRSNIASSILLNGDILESVYNASKNESKGSAQHELDTYLDSIEGKTAKLQNRIQELTASAVDSEFIKTAIDGLTKILELANSLVDTFGTLPTVLGAVGGILMQRNGWGILSKDKGTKSFGLGFAKNIKTALSDGFTKVSFSDELSKIFDGADMSTVIDKQWVKSMGGFDKLPQALQNYIQECDAAGESTITLGGAMNALGKQTSSLSGAFSALGSIGLEALSTLGTMALMTVVSMGIQAAIKGISDLIHADEIAIEKGKEAQESISDTVTSYNEQQKSLSDLQKEYAKLSTGVDASNGTVKNRNLSEDEFSRYLEISKQISEISPELVTGYDQQGNAIVNLGNTVDGVNEKFEEYLKLQRDIANAEIGGNLDTAWTGLEKEAKLYKDQIDNYDSIISENANKRSDSIRAFNTTDFQDEIDNTTISIEVANDNAKKIREILMDSADGINTIIQEDAFSGNGTTVFDVDLTNASEKTIQLLNSYFEQSKSVSDHAANLAEAQQKKTQLLLDQTYQKIIPSVQEYIRTNSIFDNIDDSVLSDSMRTGLSDMMSRIDYKSAAKDINNAGGLENWVDGIIATMSIDDPAVQHAFDDLFKLEKKRDTMQLSDYLNKRNELYQQLEDKFGEDYLSTDQLAVMFGNATRDEDGNYHDILNDRIQSAGEKIGFGGDVNFYRQISTVPIKYAESALSAIESMPQKKAKEIAGNWDKFWEYIEPYLTGKNIKSEAPTDTLSTLHNDESYKKSAEESASNLSSLTGALETLRTEGSLTAEEMVNLQNSFPDLTEFTTEAIQTKAFEELDGWIEKIREGMKGMSEEGKEQARTMIQNMVDQYGDLGLDYQDVKNAYWDLNGHSEMKGRTGLFDAQVEELRSRLESEGLELDTHVLYTLVASDQFSGTADEIYNKYNDAKLNWDIILNQQNLERQIQRNQSVLDKEETKRSLKQANGEILTKQDYETSFKSAKAIARMRGEELENATTQRDRIGRHDSVEYQNANLKVLEAEKNKLDADAEALRLEKESIEAETNVAQNVLKEADNAVSEAQNAVDKAEAEFGEGMADQKLYDDLAQATAERAVANVGLATIWRQVAERVKDEHPDWYNEFIGNAISAESSAQSDTESAKGYDNSESQKELNKLQEDATKIQRNLTVAEQNHQKVSKSTYNALIRNAKDQIKLLKEEQEGVKDNLSEWRNYQDQIDSLNDSIYEWGTTSESLFYDQASQLASAISSAMSESISETGLTDDTINALKTAFSDLDGSKFDVSDAFYSTADGVKVNTEALQELTEAEFELIGAPLANEIANVQAQLEKDPGNSALQDKLENLMETNAKYFAQYEEMQKALSRNAAIDLAEGTENAGANYDKNYGRVKTYKEAYENGLTGTDDFKAWTSYLDVYGRDTLEAYESVSGKIDRYFTEDASEGLGNFLTDMEKLGYAAQDADGYWDLTVDDYNAAAKDMQMGSDWFMDTMRKLEDYGFIHTYVSSLNEAQLKTRDVEEQIADAVQTYSDMVARGASDEELQKQIEHINELESQWQELDTVTKKWDETTEANRKKEFLNLDDQLSAFEEMYKNADTDAGREAAKKAAQDYVKQFRMTLNEEDLTKGIFRLSDESAEDYNSRIPDSTEISEVASSISNYVGEIKKAQEWGLGEELSGGFVQSVFGNVDMNKRQIIEWTDELKQTYADALASWDYQPENGSIDTVFGGSDRFGEDVLQEGVEVAFTPIMNVDGKTEFLGKDTVYGYIESLIADSTENGKLNIDKLFELDAMGRQVGDQFVQGIVAAADESLDYGELGIGNEAVKTGMLMHFSGNYGAMNLASTDREKLEAAGFTDQFMQDHSDAMLGISEAYQEDAEKTQGYIDLLKEVSREDLEKIGFHNDKYDIENHEAEDALEYLADKAGITTENIGELLDVLDLLGINLSEVQVPKEFETLDSFLTTVTKGSGAGYQISTDIFGQSAEQLQTQMDEIGTLELQVDPDSDVYEQLQELKKQTEIQLNIKNSEYTQEQLKEWAEAGDRQQIANTFGIDVDSEEVDQYIQQIKNTQLDYDMVIHVDDTQFATLMEAITGEPYEAKVDITADGSEAEEVAENTKKNIEKKPIIQTIVQKVQNFAQSLFGGGQQQQQTEVSAGMDTSGVEKGTKAVDSAMNKVNKEKGTATVDVNATPALSKISLIQSMLAQLSGIHAMPIIDQTSIGNAIQRTQQLINKLNEAAAKKAGLAIGTAHALGTTSLSRAYADGKDWTVGRDESALVNEIGQESIVRDGVWQLIPGGPHVEDLRKDDIIFNAEQTEDLIRTGKTARRGQLVAHANGTVSGMSAYSKRTKYGTSGGKIQKHSSSSDKKGNTGGGNGGNNGGKKSKSTSNKKSEFEKWLEKLFDWIEVRLDRIQRRIDISTTKAENAIGKLDSKGQSLIGTISKNKNANINAAMKQIASNASEVSENNTYIKQKNGKVTSVKGGSTDTLLGASVAGALRYQQQADQVAKVALNKNVFKSKNRKSKASQQKYMNNLISLIHSGAIDIKEYSGDVKKFIEAYKGWYDKSQDLVKSTEELRQQYKELQQTKLDNIVDEFETLVGLSEAVKSSSEATVEYYKAAGRAVGTKDEEELENQRKRQGEITKTLTSQISAFKGELVNAEKVFGKNSNEYREAQTKLEEMNKSLIESQTAELELQKSIRELSFTIRGHFITRVKALVDKLGTIASLAEKRGTTSVYGVSTRQTEDPYMEQTRYNNELILKYYEDIRDKQKEIQEFNWEVDSDQYEEAYNAITSDESAILSLLSANEDLKDSIRSLRWKPYEELNKELDDIVSDLQHVNSFIRDGEILDDDGQITERGYAQIALIAEQMDVAEQKIRNANAAMKKLEEERANDVISTEEYNEALDEQIKIIQDASSSLYDDQTKLADIYIDQITKENDILQDLIQSRKEALSAKKEYYDYDKTLRSKNKDIAQLQAQINALQGVTNDAAIAKRTKLQAELAEKQEDLNDTLYNHSIDLQQEGYDKLSEDMQTALDNAINAINGKFEALQSTAASMLTQLQTNHVDEATIINGIVTDNATALHTSTTSIINKLSGEDGVKKLIEGLGVKLGDIATLDIAGAINSRTPDSAVSNINTVLSTVQNSLGEDIEGDLREIELSIGTLKLSEEQKNQIKSEIEKLEGIDNKTSDIKEKIDKLKEILEQSDKTLQTISGNTAKGNENVGGNVNNNSEPKTEKNINPDPGRQVNQNSSSGGGGGAKQNPTKTTNADPVMAAIQTGTKRSNKVTKDEEKKHHALWTFLVKNTGYAPTNATYTRLAAALGVSVKNKNKITSAEKDNILKKLKKYETPAVTITNRSTTKPISNQMTSGLSAALTTTTTPKTTTKTTTTAKADPILAAINSGKARSKTVTAAEKKEHGDLWEYVAKKYGRSLTNAIMGKLASLLNVKVANKSKPTTAEKNVILKKLKAKKYAKGTKNLSKDVLAWTNEDWNKIGSEMIVRPSDGAILTPLKAKDFVIPANLADNLFKWGAISPDKFITNPFVGKWSAEGGGSVTNNADYTAAPQTVEMHFDSLFHIEGNVDESVMPRLENLGKSLVNDRDFQKNVIKFVTKDFVRESKKQGIR